ncbi:hypothetical protein ACMG4M_08930 [Alcanivorax sp. IL3]|uniref:hypothetical protein n=2 Tax=Alcanivorax TaxID=59753 RepID=UPI000C56DA1E|nr:hypothetical protein [Alcanivorax sp.]
MRRNNSLSHLLLGAALTLGASQVIALQELDDSSLSDVQGAGLAFAMDDFSFRFAPTSYIELTGTQAQGAGWERGDARYYGLSITNGEQIAGMDWHGSGCGSGGAFGNDHLACPMGTDNGGGIGAFASIYDPYVLRAYKYEGYDYSGAYLSTPANMPTVMELIGPSDTDRWRWSFWGELEVDRLNNNPADGALNNSYNVGGADFLQSQTIIHGKPVTTDGRPARLRLMRTTGMDSALYPWADSNTFGINYESALSGDFRFSVRQKANSEDRLHWVPDFEDNEGMYFKNVDAYLPLGQLHYQALTLDAVRSGSERGNFIIELTRIPNIAAVYEDFYCDGPCNINGNGEIQNPNEDTLGYVRWGDFTDFDLNGPSGLPGATDTNNGIYFVGGGTEPSPGAGVTASTQDVTNIGISRIEGMRIHHMKITTLGAGQ